MACFFFFGGFCHAWAGKVKNSWTFQGKLCIVYRLEKILEGAAANPGAEAAEKWIYEKRDESTLAAGGL